MNIDVNAFLDQLKGQKDSVIFILVGENDLDGFFRAIAHEDDLESSRIGMLLHGLDIVRDELKARIKELNGEQ